MVACRARKRPGVVNFRLGFAGIRCPSLPDIAGGRKSTVMPDELLTVRVDRWLLAARMFKTRSLAQEACGGGRVKVNGAAVKPGHLVKRGDEIVAESPRGHMILIVRDLADKRLSAPLARELYEDESPPPPEKAELIAPRERGAGRPTKAERRALDRLRGDESR